MSLDVYLTIPGERSKPRPARIMVRQDGATREITREEWDVKFPGQEPLTVDDPGDTEEVYSANITHNLGRMAREAGIYEHLWHPEVLGITKAVDLIGSIERGLSDLKSNPGYYKEFNASNGWGTYDNFVPFVENYLDALKRWPEANVRTST